MVAGHGAREPGAGLRSGGWHFHLRLDVRLGLVMSALLAAMLAGAAAMAPWAPPLAGLGLGLFAVGWVIQFVGHYFGPQARLCGRCDGFAGWALWMVARMGLCAGFAQKYNTPWNSAAAPCAGVTCVRRPEGEEWDVDKNGLQRFPVKRR